MLQIPCIFLTYFCTNRYFYPHNLYDNGTLHLNSLINLNLIRTTNKNDRKTI